MQGFGAWKQFLEIPRILELEALSLEECMRCGVRPLHDIVRGTHEAGKPCVVHTRT
jgi:hypothetical protein